MTLEFVIFGGIIFGLVLIWLSGVSKFSDKGDDFNDQAALVSLTEAVLKIRDGKHIDQTTAEALDDAISESTRAGARKL